MNMSLLAIGVSQLAAMALFVAPTRAQFGPAQSVHTGGGYAKTLHAADLDGDGDPDVIACRQDAPVLSWCRNDGGGASFGAPTSLPGSPEEADHARALDFDLDGDLDVAVSLNYYSAATGVDERLDYFKNQGDGTLLTSWWWEYETQIGALDVCDVDGDGDADLFFTEWSNGHVYVQLANPGGLGPPQLVASGVSNVTALRARDFDADGDADIAVAQPFSGSYSWLENGPTGFGPKLQLGSGTTGYFASLDARDLDGDGDFDLLGSLTASAGSRVQWFANQGADVFSAAITIPMPSTYRDARAGDLDGDGDNDIALMQPAGASWFANSGSGSFGAAKVITASAPGGRNLELSDIDGDGDSDVLFNGILGNNAKLMWFENLAAFVWTDLGAGLAGAAGLPALVGTGALTGGSAGKLALYAAAPAAPAALLIAPSSSWTPFACGTLVPSLSGTLVVATTSSGGTSSLAWGAWPSGLGGQTFYAQYGVLDAAAACGFAFSNALRAAVP